MNGWRLSPFSAVLYTKDLTGEIETICGKRDGGKMKFRGRKKHFIYRLTACFIALLFCLAGCSADGQVLSSDTGLSDSSAVESSSDPSDPAAPIQEFEPDPYTTEFVIDRTLAQAVRVNQGLPDDMPLTAEFAATVTELLLWDGVRIKTLTGISNFILLERLAISETDCREIEELTQMPSLTSIDISWSYIAEIPDFSGCPNLTELHLTAGCITDVTPLCKAASLRFADLSHNDISSVAPLKDVDFLEALCLEGNGITDYAAIRDSQPLCRALDAASQSPVAYALETEERAKAIVQEQTDDSMAPETKLARLYAYIIDHVTYNDGTRQGRPFGCWALCNGTGVCGDYAEALCLLARHAGLTCRVVTSETHAFNAVELDGKWYLLDSLWDDVAEETPTDALTWDYFGFTTETALAEPNHVYDTKRYPVAEQALPKTAGADFLNGRS